MDLLLLGCLGRATAKYGERALLQRSPFGDSLNAIARETLAEWTRLRPEETARRNDLYALVEAETGIVRQQAVEIARAAEPSLVREPLREYLERLPGVVRQALARLGQAAGSLQEPLALSRPQELLLLLPPRPPRFRAGDRPASLGGLVLDKLLGFGGFGEVWKARDPERPGWAGVAVKFALDEAGKRSLEREAVLKRLMREGSVGSLHAGIVRIVDSHLEDDPPCLEYEYVEGGDLAEQIRAWGANPPEDLLQRSVQCMHILADIIAFAHRLQPPVIHRDLKPSNVLLQPTNAGSALRVTDFGIGGITSRGNLSLSMQAVFTASYLGSHTEHYAPREQQRGEPANPRDDVYALGVIWYQMLLGRLDRTPGPGWHQALRKRGVPEQIIQLIGRCVAESQDRFPNADVMAHELATLVPQYASGTPGLFASPKETADHEEYYSHEAAARVLGFSSEELARKALAREIRWYQDVGGWRYRVRDIRELARRQKELRPSVNPSSAAISTTSWGMKMAFVPGGTFWMGEDGQNSQRQVTIAHDFHIGVYPVTQEEWQNLMGANPSWFCRTGGGNQKLKACSSDDLARFPVEQVSWEEVQLFVSKVNELGQESGWKYRLPTEAEWEYACRGGDNSKEGCTFDFYLDYPTNDLSSHQANFDGTYPAGKAGKGPCLERTSKVGSYLPNQLGIYDLHGNVWEWCQDWYTEGSTRVMRGGSWYHHARSCRAANRSGYKPTERSRDLGFRLARIRAR